MKSDDFSSLEMALFFFFRKKDLKFQNLYEIADSEKYETLFCLQAFMHLSLLSSREATPGICGAFDLYCFPTLGNFTSNVDHRVGMFAPFGQRNWDQVTSSCVLVCVRR